MGWRPSWFLLLPWPGCHNANSCPLQQLHCQHMYLLQNLNISWGKWSKWGSFQILGNLILVNKRYFQRRTEKRRERDHKTWEGCAETPQEVSHQTPRRRGLWEVGDQTPWKRELWEMDDQMPWRRGPWEWSDQIPRQKKTRVPMKLIMWRLLWPGQKKGCRKLNANVRILWALEED